MLCLGLCGCLQANLSNKEKYLQLESLKIARGEPKNIIEEFLHIDFEYLVCAELIPLDSQCVVRSLCQLSDFLHLFYGLPLLVDCVKLPAILRQRKRDREQNI